MGVEREDREPFVCNSVKYEKSRSFGTQRGGRNVVSTSLCDCGVERGGGWAGGHQRRCI